MISWWREPASESLLDAQQVGERNTTLGAHPSLAIDLLLDSHKYSITAVLTESLDAEAKGVALYRELLEAVDGISAALEKFARQMIPTEELHAVEVDKMLRKPSRPNDDPIASETPSAKRGTGPVRSEFLLPFAATYAPQPDTAPSRCAASTT